LPAFDAPTKIFWYETELEDAEMSKLHFDSNYSNFITYSGAIPLKDVAIMSTLPFAGIILTQILTPG
jgi:hypothetical protein